MNDAVAATDDRVAGSRDAVFVGAR